MSQQTQARDLRIETFAELTNSLSRVPSLVPNADWRVTRLQQFIDDHEGHIGYRLSDVCQTLDLGITASHASRLFRQEIGLAIREYIKLKRLHAAATKLQATSLSVKEIAADLGYQAPADFFRQFKQLFQVTPLKFRSMSRTAAKILRIDA